jgi:hypothetical protein
MLYTYDEMLKALEVFQGSKNEWLNIAVQDSQQQDKVAVKRMALQVQLKNEDMEAC